MRASIALVALLGLLGLTTPAAAQLYSWTDSNGVMHYTADPASIPPQHRPADLPPMPSAPPARGWESWGAAPAPVATVSGLTVNSPRVIRSSCRRASTGHRSRCFSTP